MDNPLGVPLEPLRLVLPEVDESTKVLLVELRGPRGSREVVKGWELPAPGKLFAPEARMYDSEDCPFGEPRETWWPGERLVVEFLGEPPVYASVLAQKKGC